MNITIYTLTHNEELLMQFMIDHYRSRFPNCHIVIYDNKSTDKTVEIALANGCEVKHFDTGGKLSDQTHWDIKQICWKNAQTDWVLVQDLDELLDINEQQLIQEDALGVTKIKSECWHMINMENNLDIYSIKYGYRNIKDDFSIVYDKDLLFNKKYVNINYAPGAHHAKSIGKIKNSRPYRLLHYIFISLDFYIAKNKRNAEALSETNKQNNWGTGCLRSEEELRKNYQQKKDQAIKIL